MIFKRIIKTTLISIGLTVLAACNSPAAMISAPVMNDTNPVEKHLTPEEVANNFYGWYLDQLAGINKDGFESPLANRSYHESPYLTNDFKVRVDEILTGFENGGYDPFLCAQDIPQEVKVFAMHENNGSTEVVMKTSFESHYITLDLRQIDSQWLIGNITCSLTPEGATKAFYVWYFSSYTNPETGERQSPLAEGLYRDSDFLSEDLVAHVDKMLATSEKGGFDPFILAQDIPPGISIDPGMTENTVIVHEMFGPGSMQHLEITLKQVSGRWVIDRITEAQPRG